MPKGVQLTARVQWSSLKGPPLYLSLTAMGEAEDFTRWNEGVQGRDEFALLHNNPWLCEDLRESAEAETRPMVPEGWMC